MVSGRQPAYDAEGRVCAMQTLPYSGGTVAYGYIYDAEGNILTVDNGATATYVYDANNRRINVTTGGATYDYIYDFMGRRISEWSPTLGHIGTPLGGRVYWDGQQQIAFISGSGATYFDHQDYLGTERMRTDYTGAVAATYLSGPWGDGYLANINESAADQDSLHFAGLDFDKESGTGHAQFRNYSSAQGRWRVAHSSSCLSGAFPHATMSRAQGIAALPSIRTEPFRYLLLLSSPALPPCCPGKAGF